MRKVMKIKILLIGFIILFSNTVFSASSSTKPDLIETITAISKEESINAYWRSLIQVTTRSSLEWTDDECDSRLVVIRADDTHLVDLVTMAFSENQRVIFRADTSVPKIDGVFCLARVVTVVSF